MRGTLACAFACIASAGMSSLVLGQEAQSDFYRGKTITIVAGSTAGGGVDLYARLLARYLPKHIAGNPTVVVQNQPGAGSLTAAHNIYGVAPKDGTQMAIVLQGALFDPLMKGEDLKDYDPRKINYLGNGNIDSVVCIARRDAPVKTYAETFDKEMVIAGTGPGSESVDAPTVERNLLGVKLKLVIGYPGSSELKLALERNEVQGVCGFQLSSAEQLFPDLLSPNGAVKLFAEEDAKANPELQKLGVPLIVDLAKTPEQKKVLQVFFAQGAVSRPFLLPPGLPADRLKMLRAAFVATMHDPDLQADAAKQKLGTNIQTGEEVQATVQSVYDAPPEIIAELRKVSVLDK
jgi:tripartite-type tricarboxylate transporter receptor subunit TctC